MPYVFLSYRREESSGHAGRLYDRLIEHFGSNNIFMDIDTIDPDSDFIEVIENAISQCDILLVLIQAREGPIDRSEGVAFKRRDDAIRLLRRRDLE